MNEMLLHAITVCTGFFAIMNPLANMPVFIGLTEGLDGPSRRKVAFQALVVSFLIILFFSAGGKMIFHLFGITLPALRITGGILVFLVGYHMLQGGASAMHSPKEEEGSGSTDEKLSVAVSPLAIPILAGPGTIATAMNYSAPEGSSRFPAPLFPLPSSVSSHTPVSCRAGRWCPSWDRV